MFRKLRLKLTLTNVAVVGVLLIILMSGLYLLMSDSLARQSAQIMGIIATDAGSGITDSHGRERDKHWFRYFYVKANLSGKIIERSPEIPIRDEDLKSLVNKALNSPRPRGQVKLDVEDGDEFRYLKAPIKSDNKMVTIVFINERSETEILGRLLGALGLIGIIGLALVFFGGLILAERALIPVKNSWERQKKFVADASHELRTPLAVIQTNLELVMDNKNETVDTQINWLENIKLESVRMNKLVEDLLFLARVDSDQELLEMKQFSLTEGIEAALRPFEPVMVKQHINFKMDIQPNLIFNGDEYRIKQLVVNLIDSALKHTPAEGRITVTANIQGSNILISISDTGEGMSEENQEKVFDRFFRIDKARSKKSGGTGLGLSISQWIVKKHGGSINLTSSPGKGTTFYISLPLN